MDVEGYHILNTIKPPYLKSKFPYSEVSPSSIVFTKKKIEIIAKKVNEFVEEQKKKNDIKDNLFKANGGNYSPRKKDNNSTIVEKESDYEIIDLSPIVIYG